MSTQVLASPNPSPSSADRMVRELEHSLSLNRIVAALQVMLASRRAARNEELALWYTVARGM